jgi:non-specific serine/threonine protein kinase
VGVDVLARRNRKVPPTPPPALVGRDTDVASLRALLAVPGTRLVTLTGPPGVGKTSLAVAVAATLGPHFPEGVVFVDLTSVRTPALVPDEIVGALGGRGGDLGPALAGRELLIVLDNFEHVLDAGPALAEALAAGAAGLRVLVTSRERLSLHAEQEVPVRPLDLPRPGDDRERVATASAVVMLLQRVRVFQPGFEVTAANSAALAEICVRLDGLPLALELAAARLRLFTPGELTFRLRHRISVLTSTVRDVPERHRTLRAALAWSHDLLGPRERTLFRRFSVFVGGATLDAVEHVCSVEEPEGVVASLVDKNLLQRRTRRGDVAELVMLESLREFAREQLAGSGEEDETRKRHTRYYADVATRAADRIGSAEEMDSVADVGVEQGNLRAALDHANAAGDVTSSLQLVGALGWYAYTRGRLGEGTTTVDAAIAAADRASAPVPDAALVGALMISGVLGFAAGDLDRAEERMRRCAQVNEGVGDARWDAIVCAFLGHVARGRGQFDTAAALHERAAALYRELGNAHGTAWAAYDLGLLARCRGELDTAARHLRAALPRFRESGYAWAVACAAWALATVELRRGRVDAAAALVVEAADGFEASDDQRGLAQCLEAAAAVACATGQVGDAARLLGVAAAQRELLGAPVAEEDRPDYDAVAQCVRAALGPDGADRGRCAGRALSRAGAAALARRVLAAPAAPPGGRLTRRELEVARLVARGRTNRQIGRALGITEKTAEVHVHNIIRKLDAHSRAEVAAWIGAHGDGTA